MKLIGCLILLVMGIIPSLNFAAVHRPIDSLKQAQTSEHPGKVIYEQYCALCHDPEPQILIGAPRWGVALEWQTRDLSDRQALFQRMDAGMGAMPPRGGCFECSDELLQAAIDYLIQGQE